MPADTKLATQEGLPATVGVAPRGALAPNELPAIAGYVLSGEIGRGAMGRVLAGRELGLDREVAIKLLLPGANAERFVTEARITAKLPHPVIPPVYWLGRLEGGSPYLAMKLVRGTTLAARLKARAQAGGDLPFLVQVFEQICQAIGFAHAQGVVHRDLKPGNVMLGAFGEVQVMDWGLAKELNAALAPGQPSSAPQHPPATGSTQRPAETVAWTPAGGAAGEQGLTHRGAILGTPAYMAPEQARGETVDARADVFALGGILCSILTGRAVFLAESETETIRLAAGGDLQDAVMRLDACLADVELVAIAKRCLSAAAADRPANGNEVGALVAAYRAGVEERLRQAQAGQAASEAKALEQFKRRRAVQIAAAVVAAVLLLGIVGTTTGLWEANRARIAESAKAAGERKAKIEAQAAVAAAVAANAQATARLKLVENTNEMLAGVFTHLDIRQVRQNQQPLERALADGLLKAAAQLDGDAVGDPRVTARLQNELGVSLLHLGFAPDAIPLLEESRQTRTKLLGPKHADTLDSMNNLGLSYADAGQFERAVPLLEETLRIRQETLGKDDLKTLGTMDSLATVHSEAGDRPRAMQMLEQVVERMTAKLGEDHPALINPYNNLAGNLQQAGQSERAISLFEKALKIEKAGLGDDHPQVLVTQGNLAGALLEAGQLQRALPLLEETLRLRRLRLGNDHPQTLMSLDALAGGYRETKQFARALPLFEEALKQRRAKLGPDHPDTLLSINNVAGMNWSLKRLDKSIPLFEEALAGYTAKLGRSHPMTQQVVANLGVNYKDARRYGDAIELLRRAYQASRQDPSLSWVRAPLAQCYCYASQAQPALPIIEELAAEIRRTLPEGNPQRAAWLLDYGLWLTQAAACADAESYLRESLALREQTAPDAWMTFFNQAAIGVALWGQKDYASAEPLLLAGYNGMKDREPTIPVSSRFLLTDLLNRLIALYKDMNRPEEAQKWQAEKERRTTVSNP